jgi:hypothetical protein
MATRNRGRRSYALIMRDGARKEFLAADAAHALNLAQEILPLGRAAVLVEDGVVLAELDYSSDGFWAVSASAANPC